MLSLPPSCRIFLATAPCDMRKGFDGLLAEVRRRWTAEDPFAGHVPTGIPTSSAAACSEAPSEQGRDTHRATARRTPAG